MIASSIFNYGNIKRKSLFLANKLGITYQNNLEEIVLKIISDCL